MYTWNTVCTKLKYSHKTHVIQPFKLKCQMTEAKKKQKSLVKKNGKKEIKKICLKILPGAQLSICIAIKCTCTVVCYFFGMLPGLVLDFDKKILFCVLTKKSNINKKTQTC